MPRVNFPLGYEGSRSLPTTNRSLVGCFNTGKNSLLAFPGIKPLNTTSGTARANFVWNDRLYQVVSQQLIEITDVESGAFTVIGTISGTSPIRTAVGFSFIVILVQGGDIYSLDEDNDLILISGNPNFLASADVANIDDIFVYIPSDGGPAYYSDVGQPGVVQAASFVDAESLTDKNKAVWVIRGTLYICGAESIEPFSNTGGTPNVFTRIPKGRIDTGFIGGKLEFGNTFIFIGRPKDQVPGIYALSSGIATKISNERIDVDLSDLEEEILEEAVSARLIWDGYDIAIFSFRFGTIGFVKGNWFLLDTIEDDRSGIWQGGFLVELEGRYYTAYGSKIGRIDSINTDYGLRKTRLMQTAVDQASDDWFSIGSFQLRLSQGFNSVDGTVALRVSRNSVQYGPEVYIDLGKVGEYSDKLKWNPAGGVGKFQGYAGIEVYTTADINFSADAIIAELR